MKKIIIVVAICLGIGPLLFLGSAFFLAQRADYGWSPGISTPRFTGERPRILVDEAHFNASSVGFAGRYWPFGRLLRADGYAVERGKGNFTLERLRGVRVFVIANASGAPKPQFFGMNLPVRTLRKRSDPAFEASEIEAVRSWVEQGGSLLLIADHAPFGEAAAGLGLAFGVTMHKGFVEVPNESSDPLLFSIANGRLGHHAILRGDSPGSGIHRVMTYTGQSLDAPEGATVLLRLPDSAVEAVPQGDTLAVKPAGHAQGIAFEVGQGRIVVLGEGGMVTAQVNRMKRYGMNTPDNDNRQFVLNVMHWLSRAPLR